MWFSLFSLFCETKRISLFNIGGKMTEKDFRKLVTDLEILNTEKQELHCRFDRLQEKLAKHQDDYFRIVSVKKSGSWAKGTLLNDVDKIDIMVGIELNKPNSFVLDKCNYLEKVDSTDKSSPAVYYKIKGGKKWEGRLWKKEGPIRHRHYGLYSFSSR